MEMIKKYIDDLWAVDPGALGGRKAALIKAMRFCHLAMTEFTEGQINFRAMSLVYTTLMSFVPLLAVSFSVLKAFGVHNQIEPALANLLAPLGPGGEEITKRIIGFVGNMKVGVLGSLGLAMLMYTVVSVVGKMEESLNYIWKVKNPRSLARRFSDYTSVLLVGPVMIFAAIGLTAGFKSATIVKWLLEFQTFGFAFYILGIVLPYVITCFAFTFTYVFIPNVKVGYRSALAGGIFAGIAWQLTGWWFASFVASSGQYSAIYSGFAAIVLFMFWMYLSWLIFLVGGAVSYYHQNPRRMLYREEPVFNERLKERLAFSVMYLAGRDFLKGGAYWTDEALAKELNAPLTAVQDTLASLTEAGLLIEADDTERRYLPARDLGAIHLTDVLDSVRTCGVSRGAFEARPPGVEEVDPVMKRVDDAVKAAIAGETLRGLVETTDERRL